MSKHKIIKSNEKTMRVGRLIPLYGAKKLSSYLAKVKLYLLERSVFF